MSVIVAQVIPTKSAQHQSQYLANARAHFRKYEEGTGLALYKTAAGVVYRASKDGKKLEILNNCTC